MTEETMPSERAREALEWVDIVSQYIGLTFDAPYPVSRQSARDALVKLGRMAALAEQPVPAVGWRPGDPITDEMEDAGAEAYHEARKVWLDKLDVIDAQNPGTPPTIKTVAPARWLRPVFEAMLSAAPAPSADREGE